MDDPVLHLIERQGNQGCATSLLGEAVEGGSIDVIKYLVEQGVSTACNEDVEKCCLENVIDIAERRGDSTIIEYLVELNQAGS